jgi:hypothetical protein
VPSLPLPPALSARLARAVRGLVEAEVAEELDLDDLSGLPGLDETARVLQGRLLGMPRHFATGMVVLTLGFEEVGRFSQLPLARRRRRLARLRALPLGPLKNFSTFYDKMAPFVFWSVLEESGQLDAVLAEAGA